MKIHFFSFVLAMSAASITHGLAQCSLNFANFGAGINAPVTDFQRSLKLNGPGFVAGLFYAPGVVTDSTLLTGPYKTASFTTNGYFFGGAALLYGLQPETTITVQVRVWNAADFGSWQEASGTEAGWAGASPLFQVTPTTPPLPPASMTGLQPFKAGLFLDCIFPPPGPTPLRISAGSGILSLTWPARVCDRYVLLQATNLVSGNWGPLPDSRVLVGRTNGIEFQMHLPIPTNSMFYHLSWQ